jgi:colanic acid biosynthesis glycosyl transferase WcaI
MKILVASINFHPEHSGIALYSTDLPLFMAEQGQVVTMVTGFPYYPTWKKRPEDKGRLFSTEIYKNVKTLRGYLYVPTKVTTPKRILHELSFAFFAALNFLRAGRQDCIVVLSPPLLLGVVGVFFKWLWRAQLVFHIQDLQPDAALSLGMVRKGLMIRTLLRIESFIYRHSDWVATISQGMLARLIDKGVPREKLGLYYNWIDVAEAGRQRPAGHFRSKHRAVADKFLVAYAGNIGIKQGVDVLVETAALMQDVPWIHFFIIGDGADRERLLRWAQEKRLNNLTFLPFLSQDDYFDMLQDIDLSFVAQKANTGNVFFPSKLLGIMAMGKPILVSADPGSELATVVSQSGCGLVVPAGDARAAAKQLSGLVENSGEIARIGSRGREAVKAFDRKVVLGAFLNQIRSFIPVPSRRSQGGQLASGKPTLLGRPKNNPGLGPDA